MLVNLGRKVILWSLVISLSGAHLIFAAVRETIGQVVRSSGASLDGMAIPEDRTIVSDDVLSTAKGGSALVKFSADTQVTLMEETSVGFRRDAGHSWARISSGTLAVTSASNDALVVETPKYRIAPTEPAKATYVVGLLPDKRTVVAARFGPVSITETSSGEAYLLSEGDYALIPALSSGVPGQGQRDYPQAAQSAHGKINEPWHIGRLSHEASILLVTGIVAGTATAIAILLATRGGQPASPSVP